MMCRDLRGTYLSGLSRPSPREDSRRWHEHAASLAWEKLSQNQRSISHVKEARFPWYIWSWGGKRRMMRMPWLFIFLVAVCGGLIYWYLEKLLFEIGFLGDAVSHHAFADRRTLGRLTGLHRSGMGCAVIP